jgi:hypothetical protein
MSDTYLIEAGIDSYLLEDSSGVLYLEDGTGGYHLEVPVYGENSIEVGWLRDYTDNIAVTFPRIDPDE